MRKRPSHFSLSAFLLLVLVSCSQNNGEQKDERIFFNVASERLDLTFIDSVANFSVRIPDGLQRVNPSPLLNQKFDHYDSLVLALYMDSISRSAVIIKTIPEYQKVLWAVQNPVDSNGSDANWQATHHASFIHNRLRMHQIIQQNADVICIRLLFEHNGAGREITYLNDQKLYADALPGIESSIGSIGVLKNMSHLTKK